jgi:hypothetical protein
MLTQAPLLGAQRGISVVRLVGGSLIALVWLMALGSIAVVFYEYALPRTKSAKELPLMRAGYYKTARPGDPYTPFTTQHLHPIYLFFFPLDPGKRVGLSNETVSITKHGFRGGDPIAGKPLAVLLGGSAAFGDKASSDQTTITGCLNRLQTSYHFVNAGVPSWTSTQELHRLADQIAPLAPKLVISYSFSNDIVIALSYARKGLVYPPGSPKSFEYLSKLVDDIRGSPRLTLADRIKGLFPRTAELLENISGKQNVNALALSNEQLMATVESAVDKFLWNQKIMQAIASSMHFRFITVIQPSLRAHKNVLAEDRDRISVSQEDRWLFERAVQRIMASEYCHENCLDYSNLFDNQFAEIPVFRGTEETRNPESLIFADIIHLLDSGNEYVARHLVQDLGLRAIASP